MGLKTVISKFLHVLILPVLLILHLVFCPEGHRLLSLRSFRFLPFPMSVKDTVLRAFIKFSLYHLCYFQLTVHLSHSRLTPWWSGMGLIQQPILNAFYLQGSTSTEEFQMPEWTTPVDQATLNSEGKICWRNFLCSKAQDPLMGVLASQCSIPL